MNNEKTKKCKYCKSEIPAMMPESVRSVVKR